MALITQTLPPKYNDYAELLYGISDYKYKSERTKKFRYFHNNFCSLIAEVNKEENVLLKEEKDFLELSTKTFKKGVSDVSFEKYYELLTKALTAIVARTKHIRNSLITLIKRNNLKSTKEDDQILFVIENTERQLLEVASKIKKISYKQIGDSSPQKLLKTTIKIIENYFLIAVSVATEEYDAVKQIKDSSLDILSDDFLKLDLTNKIAA